MDKRSFYKTGHDACEIGMIVNMNGRADHKTVRDALWIAEKAGYRPDGGLCCRPVESSGVLVHISHCFFRKAAEDAGIFIRNSGDYGVGMFFFPGNKRKRDCLKRLFKNISEKNGVRFLGWRDVPVDPEILGKTEKSRVPYVCQGFTARPADCAKGMDFDRRLYEIRREFEKIADGAYVCSLSSRTIVYKGMVPASLLACFYTDMKDRNYKTSFAMAYSGTSASSAANGWERTCPYRMTAYDSGAGLSPVRADLMTDGVFESEIMKGDGLSERLLYSGALTGVKNTPAAFMFCDGDIAGAIVDLEGTRPVRYCITDDRRLIFSSGGCGMIVSPEHMVKKSRLLPGCILAADIKQKKIICDEDHRYISPEEEARSTGADDTEGGKSRTRDRRDPEYQMYSHDVHILKSMQQAIRDNDYDAFKDITAEMEKKEAETFRRTAVFVSEKDPIPLYEAEPVFEIVKRLSIKEDADVSVSRKSFRQSGKEAYGKGTIMLFPALCGDVRSERDLEQLIFDLKNADREKQICVKLLSGENAGREALLAADAGAEVIRMAGLEGKDMLRNIREESWKVSPEAGISEAQRALIRRGVRGRVVLEAEGRMKSGRDIAVAALLGADRYCIDAGPLFDRDCRKRRLRNLDGSSSEEPEQMETFLYFIAKELREIMAGLGFRTVSEMVGRSDRLAWKKTEADKKTPVRKNVIQRKYAAARYRRFDPCMAYDFHLERTVDEAVLLPEFFEALNAGEHHEKCIKVEAKDRSVGVILGSEIQRRYDDSAEDTFVVKCEGESGRSFGAFAPKGLTMRLEGDADDNFGRGLSGGKLTVVPPRGCGMKTDANIIVGNMALYGAESGKAYIRGKAGDYFCCRNAGAAAAAEGCGDHSLKDMTGGCVVILGTVGKDFASGISGGAAYVLDENDELPAKLNVTGTEVTCLDSQDDINALWRILLDYRKETGSVRASEILEDPEHYLPLFRKVVPAKRNRMVRISYKREYEDGLRAM